jgi:uncharacterized membrane protein YbhN (UPF0104 family)
LKTLIKVLKIAIPLSLGLYLAYYSFASIEDKDKVGQVLSRANYLFIFLSILFSWLSHYARSARSQILLEPMGYKTSVWNNYHAVMVGYFMNLLLPRAGEISRAGVMTRTEKVPFEKAFGAIIAERVIDVIMLATISLITIGMQYSKFELLWGHINEMKTNQGSSGSSPWFFYVLIVLGVLALGAMVLYVVHKGFRSKINGLIKGLMDGLLTIIKLKKRWQFIGYTFLIWFLYIALYLICFYSIEETSGLELKGLMLGFLGGSIGIILVQGGIGVYPVMVATALALYGADRDIVIALGWVVWAAQTILLIVAGAVSFYVLSKKAV